MSKISPAVRQLAEEPDTQVAESPPPGRRLITPRFTLGLSPSPSQSGVLGVRTSVEELDATIAEIRGIVREAGYTRTVWHVGPSSRPEGLAGLLVARGFVPASRPPFEPEATAMALVEPPPPPPPGVEARLVRDLDEFVQGLRIAMEAFGESEEDAAGWLAAAPLMWKYQDGVNRFAHLAFQGGQPVGFAFAASAPDGLLLGGGGVLPRARGRGAYRALVAARWTEAVRLGRPALVIHAGAMSRPILERCGFERVCTLDVLEDPAVARGS
jgi:hypothetical protein